MSAEQAESTDPILAARRELHELTILSSALLRLATRVQQRCETLRHTLGDTAPIQAGEVDRYAPPGGERRARPRDQEATEPEEEEPAALLAMSLAGEGMSREQIGDYLRHSFGMQDVEALLDRVLPREH